MDDNKNQEVVKFYSTKQDMVDDKNSLSTTEHNVLRLHSAIKEMASYTNTSLDVVIDEINKAMLTNNMENGITVSFVIPTKKVNIVGWLEKNNIEVLGTEGPFFNFAIIDFTKTKARPTIEVGIDDRASDIKDAFMSMINHPSIKAAHMLGNVDLMTVTFELTSKKRYNKEHNLEGDNKIV